MINLRQIYVFTPVASTQISNIILTDNLHLTVTDYLRCGYSLLAKDFTGIEGASYGVDDTEIDETVEILFDNARETRQLGSSQYKDAVHHYSDTLYIKIRRFSGRLIFIKGIPIPKKDAVYIESLVNLFIFSIYLATPLTHLPLVPHIYVSESDQHWFK